MIEEGQEIDEEEFEALRAMTGFQAEDFKNSQLGRYIYDHVENELVKLRIELEDCDPRDEDENIRIRNEIRIRKMFFGFVEDAIRSGRRAEANLELLNQPEH